MLTLDIARSALRSTWQSRSLWAFGILLAGGWGSSHSGERGTSAIDDLSGGALFLAVAGAAALVAAVVALHVISEAAVVESIRRTIAGDRISCAEAWRTGIGKFRTVLMLKVLGLGGLFLAAGVLSVPVVGGLSGMIPVWWAITFSAVATLAAAPWILSGYFTYVYAVRISVVERIGAREAILRAWRYLPGRVLESVQLLILAFVGQLAGSLCILAAIAPGLASWYIALRWSGSTSLALAVGVAVSVAPAIAAVGAVGTYRSAVWTTGFLESRTEEGA